jgi:SAM-dependent methyltransferase
MYSRLERGWISPAANGGRSAFLAVLGHEVIGVDTSPEMLRRAREKVPGGQFHEGDLHDLPLPASRQLGASDRPAEVGLSLSQSRGVLF